jgi:hypothetical protein
LGLARIDHGDLGKIFRVGFHQFERLIAERALSFGTFVGACRNADLYFAMGTERDADHGQTPAANGCENTSLSLPGVGA